MYGGSLVTGYGLPSGFLSDNFLSSGRSMFASLFDDGRGQIFHVYLKRDVDDLTGRNASQTF